VLDSTHGTRLLNASDSYADGLGYRAKQHLLAVAGGERKQRCTKNTILSFSKGVPATRLLSRLLHVNRNIFRVWPSTLNSAATSTCERTTDVARGAHALRTHPSEGSARRCNCEYAGIVFVSCFRAKYLMWRDAGAIHRRDCRYGADEHTNTTSITHLIADPGLLNKHHELAPIQLSRHAARCCRCERFSGALCTD
jgi:hypothetical protein